MNETELQQRANLIANQQCVDAHMPCDYRDVHIRCRAAAVMIGREMQKEIDELKREIEEDNSAIRTQHELIKSGEARGEAKTIAENERLQKLLEEQREEIKRTWKAARDSGSQLESFRILERMADRLGYGRTENNPSLA